MASIIGREYEIDAARHLVEDDQIRLVTLTGPGGVGKTRLALEVAAESAPHFDGNVSFIPLAALTETTLLLSQIASDLGVSDSVDPIEGMRQLMRGAPRLLVLDNLEQLPNAGLELARLLRAVGGLSILSTSRSPLVMYGEYVFPVDPLPIPPRGADDATLAASPAIQLLVDSARSANAARALFPGDYAVLAEIARRVDGLPLAIELAGAYIPLLGPRGVLDALRDAFSVLGGGPADMPERLQTVRNAIGWSYNLLTPDEQAFFRRLSVFNGGFTLEMAEAMARGWERSEGYPFFFGIPFPYPWMIKGREGPELEPGRWYPEPLAPLPVAPLTGLESLERKNVIRAVRTDSGIDRFDLLETIREFGLEQLDLEGERAAAEHARAVLLTGIAEMTSQAMWGGAWRPAVAWAEAELPNMRAVLAWLATQPPDGNQLALRMVETLWPFWQSRGYVQEGCEHLEVCLKRPGGDPLMRAQALNLLAALSWIRNDLARASSALDEALPVLERTALFVGQGRNFMTRALVAWSQDEIDRMEKMARIGSDRYLRGGDVLGPAICSLILGFAQRLRGQRNQAVASFAEAYRGCLDSPGSPFPWGMAIAQYFLGEMAREDGNRVAAVSNIREALTAFVDLGDPWTVGGCVGTLAIYLVEDGELEEAARLLGASAALESSTGVFLPPTETAIHEATARDVKLRIGPDAFAARFAEGQMWSMEEAATHATRVPMESVAGRAARMARPAVPVQELPTLTDRQLRTLQLTADGLSVEEVGLADGVAKTSVYERFDRIKERFGLPPNASIADVMMLAVYYGFVEPRRFPPSRRPL
jgi:predicted ATPase